MKVVKAFILPVLRAEADRLQSVLEGPLGNNTDRIAADHVKLALLVTVTLIYPQYIHDESEKNRHHTLVYIFIEY